MFARFLLRRVLLMVPILLIVAVMVFMLMHLIPGDPAVVILGEMATPQTVAALRHELGLDQPLAWQFFGWLGQVVQGNLGRSLIDGTPVVKILSQRLPITLELGALAFASSAVIALPAGIVSAARRGSAADYGTTILALAGLSIPSFWLGIMLILFFAVQLHLLPAGGYVPFSRSPLQNLVSLILPALSVGVRTAAVMARQLRAALLEVFRADFIRTAEAKGVSRPGILFRHALKNALMPVVTVAGLELGGLLGGIVFTEVIFDIPGLGSLLVQSIMQRDYITLQGGVLVAALIVVTVNLLTDIAYSLIDPRIQLAGERRR
ncbi:MAG TPA: ABC transporter permease [Bacillota bacterium]|nr:ABC transporter permease [Bacillota bacterium]